MKKPFFNPRLLLSFAFSLVAVALAVLAFTLSSGAPMLAQPPGGAPENTGQPDVVPIIGPVSQDMDLRVLPQIPQTGESEERRLTRYPRFFGKEAQDPLREVRRAAEVVAMPTPNASFSGINAAESGCGCLPPDTNGDVGLNHYIQSVNSSIKIFSKTGSVLLPATTYNSFFSALAPTGTPCGTNQNQGDGIVFYDQMADRWVVSDFAFPAFPGVSFYQCIGVSKTSNPVTGGWWLYAIQHDPANPQYLGDYAKFGLWPDAWYFTVNLFTNNTTFNGVRVYALPRAAMINGAGAPNTGAIAFTITPATLGSSYSLVPATFRIGNPPFSRSEYLLAIDSPATAGVVQTQVHVWRFHVDFATPVNSTLGVGANHAANANIAVNGFVDAYTSTHNIVPQPGTTSLLDTLGDRIMTPVVYQTDFIGNGESLWASHTINNNQGGTGPTAIRWYQFNVHLNTIPATATQQQTFNNGSDGIWRFMPSIAVDAVGNMALGYSASSSSVEPSIRWAGRLVGDAANTLAQGEAIVQAGGGHQTSSLSRWGDYSSMSIDRADNLSFWHANEIYSATSTANWATRIGRFRFYEGPIAASAVSRKAHFGEFGNFDVNLPLAGNAGIESRTGLPITGQHQIIVDFYSNVAVASASASPAPAVVSSFNVDGFRVTVNLSGVPEASRISILLSGVNDGVVTGNVTIPAAFLLGDTNADGFVNAGDALQTRNRSGQTADVPNFRSDVNVDGVVNSGDTAVVRARSGSSVP